MSINEAKVRLGALVHVASTEGGDVVLLEDGQPAAVIVGAQRFQAMIDLIEDLEDRLSVHEARGETISLRDIDEDDLAGS
ncbi:type II toxin-antitoxin system Phd/YefM family antitoxin [Calidifontibacter sp. DB0510]|uniref:Type II toxin-antitoxin system Phd/YefM family antitoxin n=1 Tax=Metallococcus carri TaxID=1656884 RepID=A0A967AZI9_9MICO|nr:type II toxin-antitoxin system Phd/YefM family antitoxin [Metallococcus carri]NHN55986.1 type II toxin-antitoxin system Phd/YefM family antitoxin [Metallococcus carri]NOP37557.1 type II toxin-antitoxin system Phd/YefM family antitoxin [Calidifontibacter sp. DB2511S]